MVTNINLQIIAETVTRNNVPLQSPSKHRPEKKKKVSKRLKKRKGKKKNPFEVYHNWPPFFNDFVTLVYY